MNFPTDSVSILKRLNQIDAEKYGYTRNFIDGAVTYLSPYISRGVLSTRDVFEHLKKQNLPWSSVEKLIQELAWRDFFQTVWMKIGDEINRDIKNPQSEVRSREMCSGVKNATTDIDAIDSAVNQLYATGYMHNHFRMYVVSLTCNLSRCHWFEPAKWMYYHLLDADWASNACSWQWVAGAFSNKKYWANQENINKYAKTEQLGTYLDTSYEELPNIRIPGQLQETEPIELLTNLPKSQQSLDINPKLKTLVYNWYNMDFNWHASENCNRILLLEPQIFEKYPISDKSVQFLLDLSKNIPNVQIFVGSFDELQALLNGSTLVYKEHPLNDYVGVKESRTFLCEIPQKNFNSFFGFWKAIQPKLMADFNNK